MDLTFHFHQHSFQFLQHDFQHGSSWIEFDSSLLCVENHVLKLKRIDVEKRLGCGEEECLHSKLTWKTLYI